MKRTIGIVVLAILILNLVGFTVFLSGNDKPTTTTKPAPETTVDTTPQTDTQQTTTTTEQPSGISRAVLAQHNSRSDCWVAYGGQVYDITSFLPKHPGSPGAIAPYCGTADEFETAFIDQHGTSKVSVLQREGVPKGALL